MTGRQNGADGGGAAGEARRADRTGGTAGTGSTDSTRSTRARYDPPPGVDAHGYAQLALRHGAEVVPGNALDTTGAHDGHLRLPCSFAPDTARELVSRLTAAWKALSRTR
ncbi:hypothetical protein ACFW6F_21510 [Streptomyces sp. NPDC058746]|uniref:hypothetical protein n=1 Tax=Streptomyces sp. NPDC058746 TaxID=3346622 RepID=UPI0036AEAFEA